MPYLGLPEYVWNGIFQVAEVLLIGLLLGYFASRYQKRKETEYGLQGEVAMQRVGAYRRIIRAVNEIYHSIAPAAVHAEEIGELLSGMPFVMPTDKYPTFMDGEERFDRYYIELSHICAEEHIFLDGNVEYRLNDYLNYLSELKMMLDAFCDLEFYRKDIDDLERKRQKTLAYRAFGVALSNDFGKFYNDIDNVITREVKHMTLGFRNKRLRVKIHNMSQTMAVWLTARAHKGSKLQRRCAMAALKLLYFGKNDRQLLCYAEFLVLLLMRIYYSNRYTLEEIDALPDEKRSELIKNFHTAYIALCHHG